MSLGVDEIQAGILKYGGQAVREQVYTRYMDKWKDARGMEYGCIMSDRQKKEINSPVKTTGG
jgi:hypothetical protein